MFVMNVKSRKPLGIKEKPPFPAAFEWWSCGESNPGTPSPKALLPLGLLGVNGFF